MTAEQLDDALAQQQRTGEPIGEILVARGLVSRIDLAGALSAQWSWRPGQQEAARPPVQRVEGTAARPLVAPLAPAVVAPVSDRKSTRLNSSHRCISYAVFC